MSMSKKDFVAMADVIRTANKYRHGERNPQEVFPPDAVQELADVCAAQNPRFNRNRWRAYIAGECGPNGGKVKGGKGGAK